MITHATLGTLRGTAMYDGRTTIAIQLVGRPRHRTTLKDTSVIHTSILTKEVHVDMPRGLLASSTRSQPVVHRTTIPVDLLEPILKGVMAKSRPFSR